MQIIKVKQKPKESRLDRFLVSQTKNVSRSKIQNNIKEGLILVNKKPTSPNYEVKKDDVINLNLVAPSPMELKAENLAIKVIFEDDSIILIDKKAGMVTHPTADHVSGTVVNWLLYHLKDLPKTDIRVGIVHRLDKGTSGLLLVGKNQAAVENLKKQFANRTVKKKYLTLVMGEMEKPFGTIKSLIGRDPHSFQKFATLPDGKISETDYRLLQNYKKFSFLEVFPKTGRTHQIRVHLSSIGHPIVGDKLYGGKMLLPRIFLHAAEIDFLHPVSGEKMHFVSPLPADLQLFLDKLSLEQG